MMNTNPRVTVAIPCYNSGEILRETLDSVLAQTYRDFEIVCVDDLSSDQTLDILKEYQRKYPELIRVIQNERDEEGNKKRKSFNLCAENARGELILLHGHDDLLSPDLLASSVRRMDETDSDCVLSRIIQFSVIDGVRKEHLIYEGYKGDMSIVISGREATMLSLDWQIHSWGLWRLDVYNQVSLNERENVFDLGELEDRRRFILCRRVAFSAGTQFYRTVAASITHKPYGRYTHTRLTTNREVLSLIKEAKLPQQCINAYQIQTYRMLCGVYARFILSAFYRTNGKGRRSVRKELKEYFRDPRVIDREKLSQLCPSLLDQIRLRCFWSIIPITFWRKLFNRLSGKTSIF